MPGLRGAAVVVVGRMVRRVVRIRMRSGWGLIVVCVGGGREVLKVVCLVWFGLEMLGR